MSKRNEGYTLPFVLVVMIVLCLVATSLMSLSLRNLQSQQRVMEKMEKKYQAQGAIEIVVGQLMKIDSINGTNETEALKAKITEICQGVYGSDDTSDPKPEFKPDISVKAEESKFQYDFSIQSIYESIQIDCDFLMEGTISEDTESDAYMVEVEKLTYKSYTISNTGGGAG